jgi:peptidoglycan/xylan/chitin deacetylase (PgdA/CDA1 family)
VTRWDWTWEERIRPAEPLAEVKPSPPLPAPPSRDVGRFRRRRAGVLLGVVALVAVVLSLLGGQATKRTSAHLSRIVPLHKASASESQARLARAENEAVDRVLSYTPIVTRGGASGNEVALTFDDGPGPYTQHLVSVLDSLRVKATFFVVGKQERYFSAGTAMEINAGDAIGDHTETHPMMASLSKHDQREQLFEQAARIEVLGGSRPRLFRPPYGSFNATTLHELHVMHMLMVLWSTDTEDYTRPGVHAIVENALAGARPGAIILMHDAGGDRSQTIAALPTIIRGLRKRGLRPVTIPRLMLDDPPPRGLPIPKSLAGD